MNAAMERAGQDERLDARSYRERGREDLEELKEPKLLGGSEAEAQALREQVKELRQKRAELPAPHLEPAAVEAAAIQQIERETEAAIAEVEQRRDRQFGILDKLIEKARAFAVEVKRRAAAAAERQRRAAETARLETEQRAAEEKEVRARIEVLWRQSPAGQRERVLQQRCEDDRVRLGDYEENLRQAENDLAAWKKRSWTRSLLFENTALKAQVADAENAVMVHQKSAEANTEALAASEARKQAALPELRRQAAEDVKEIAVRLQPEHARLLIQNTFGYDRVAARAAFAQVEAGTHTLKVLDGLVELENREPEGFTGYLRQMHKPLLDRTIGDLLRAQERAVQREKQAERERSRGWRDRGRGGYGE